MFIPPENRENLFKPQINAQSKHLGLAPLTNRLQHIADAKQTSLRRLTEEVERQHASEETFAPRINETSKALCQSRAPLADRVAGGYFCISSSGPNQAHQGHSERHEDPTSMAPGSYQPQINPTSAKLCTEETRAQVQRQAQIRQKVRNLWQEFAEDRTMSAGAVQSVLKAIGLSVELYPRFVSALDVSADGYVEYHRFTKVFTAVLLNAAEEQSQARRGEERSSSAGPSRSAERSSSAPASRDSSQQQHHFHHQVSSSSSQQQQHTQAPAAPRGLGKERPHPTHSTMSPPKQPTIVSNTTTSSHHQQQQQQHRQQQQSFIDQGKKNKKSPLPSSSATRASFAQEQQHRQQPTTNTMIANNKQKMAFNTPIAAPAKNTDKNSTSKRDVSAVAAIKPAREIPKPREEAELEACTFHPKINTGKNRKVVVIAAEDDDERGSVGEDKAAEKKKGSTSRKVVQLPPNAPGFQELVDRLEQARRTARPKFEDTLRSSSAPPAANTTDTVPTNSDPTAKPFKPTVVKPFRLACEERVGGKKPLLMYVDVDMPGGRKGRIAVHGGDTASRLAANFAATYSLEANARAQLTALLEAKIAAHHQQQAAAKETLPFVVDTAAGPGSSSQHHHNQKSCSGYSSHYPSSSVAQPMHHSSAAAAVSAPAAGAGNSNSLNHRNPPQPPAVVERRFISKKEKRGAKEEEVVGDEDLYTPTNHRDDQHEEDEDNYNLHHQHRVYGDSEEAEEEEEEADIVGMEELHQGHHHQQQRESGHDDDEEEDNEKQRIMADYNEGNRADYKHIMAEYYSYGGHPQQDHRRGSSREVADDDEYDDDASVTSSAMAAEEEALKAEQQSHQHTRTLWM